MTNTTLTHRSSAVGHRSIAICDIAYRISDIAATSHCGNRCNITLQRCCLWLYTLFVCNILVMGILWRFQFIQISQYRAYTQCPALCLQYTARYPQPGGHVCRVDLSREDTANFPSMCAHKEFSHTYLYFYYL